MQQQQSDSFLQSFQEEEQKTVKEQLELLLEQQLKQLEKYLKSDEEANEILNLVQHCNTTSQLAELNITLFDHLFNKIDHKLQKYKQKSQIKLLSQKKVVNKSTEDNVMIETNYEKLEKQVQKYEAEIRNHISVEQQLKIYAESLQSQVSSNIPSQVDNFPQEKKSTENKNSYQKENKQLLLNIKNCKNQISEMKQKLNEQQILINIFQEKEKNQKQLLENYEKFDNMIQHQQKSKIQNIRNFKNYNIYNLKQNNSMLSNEKNSNRGLKTNNKVVYSGTNNIPTQDKLIKQRNNSAQSLNIKQNSLQEVKGKNNMQETMKKKYKNMVMNKQKLKSQEIQNTNNNLKKDILANLQKIKGQNNKQLY